MIRPDPLDPDVLRAKLLAHSFLSTVGPLDRQVCCYLEQHDVDLEAIEASG